MWRQIDRWLSEFGSAVLSVVDTRGFPFSLRCTLVPDRLNRLLRLRVDDLPALQHARAGLLFHNHDEHLSNQHSFLLTGILLQDEEGWLFFPERFIPGMGLHGRLSQIRFLLKGQSRARRYLARRNLQRPQVDWEALLNWMEVVL